MVSKSHEMKRLFITLVILLVSVPMMWGQSGEMSVKEFYLAQTDLTANIQGTMVYDQNDNLCALIKLMTTAEGFTFDVGVLGISEVKRVGGEIWIYVPFGVRKISITHATYGTIKDYQFPSALEKGKTYILSLNLPKVERKYDEERRQKMILQVDPPTAQVHVNGIPQNLSSTGIYEGDYQLGLYDITVSAPRYNTREITVALHDQSATHHQQVSLKPKYGWLTLPLADDENLYIDGVHTSYTSGTALSLDTGSYEIKVEKPSHVAYVTTVEMQDSLTVALSPTFVSRYGRLGIRSSVDPSDIYIDGTYAGKTPISVPMLIGTYEVVLKKDGYKDETAKVTVEEGVEHTINMTMDPYMNVRITSNADASLYIDEKYIGDLPVSTDVMSGKHKVKLTADGYLTKTKKIDFNTTGKTYDFKLRKDPYESRGLEAGFNYHMTPDGGLYSAHIGLSLFKYLYADVEISDQLAGIHAGLNFNLGKRVQMRPVVGVMTDQYDANASYFTSGLKFSTALVKHLELAITPQYLANLDPTSSYDRYGGFGCSVGVVVYLSSSFTLLAASAAAALLL